MTILLCCYISGELCREAWLAFFLHAPASAAGAGCGKGSGKKSRNILGKPFAARQIMPTFAA